MRLKNAIPSTPKPGQTVIIKRFAWKPTQISGAVVWLEYYNVLMLYHGTSYQLMLEDKATTFMLCKWIELSKRLAA